MTKNYFRHFVWLLLAMLGVAVGALAVKTATKVVETPTSADDQAEATFNDLLSTW